jgi:hypothetical protein
MLLLVDGLNALCQNEKTLVDAGRFDHSLFVVLCPSVVFGAREVDGGSRADANLLGRCYRDFDTEYGVRSRRVRVQLLSMISKYMLQLSCRTIP